MCNNGLISITITRWPTCFLSISLRNITRFAPLFLTKCDNFLLNLILLPVENVPELNKYIGQLETPSALPRENKLLKLEADKQSVVVIGNLVCFLVVLNYLCRYCAPPTKTAVCSLMSL
jgi:hypothetical protein